ncbi:MAG TPA: NADH-quinone oxidoreductase subunit C [Terracidiphilus sp.]|nr:NADH-quinone oxidoreductase subunit C [Terracidiphilus sp.]
MTINTTTRGGEGSAEDALRLLESRNTRLVSIFGSLDESGAKRVHYIADVNREYRIISVRITGALPSATLISPAAAWHERELHDQYGIEIDGHPDLRPLMSHPAEYRFLQVQGVGVCELPVGPVHAGIIEPGHFRFSVMGDSVLHLEPRLFYTHKGTEKLLEGTSIIDGPALAESVSGDNCFAHAVAYCQSVENAFGISVPPRGRAIRLIGLELERMMAHIADAGALCGDVGCVVPAAYTARIKESLLRASARCFGTRFWRGIATPGGVRRDLSAESAREFGNAVAHAAADFAEMARIVLDTPSVLNRFEGTGILSNKIARDFGAVGPVARASGVRIDVRHDHPYGHYRNITVETLHFQQGDVLSRARMRIEETRVSSRLIQDTLNDLAAGIISTRMPRNGSAEGFSAVESPRGELLYWIRIRNGRIARCHIKSPSFQNWPGLPFAVAGNISADFPLINKSFNLSYSGCDR